jgi:hypothetical protein
VILVIGVEKMIVTGMNIHVKYVASAGILTKGVNM